MSLLAKLFGDGSPRLPPMPCDCEDAERAEFPDGPAAPTGLPTLSGDPQRDVPLPSATRPG